MPARNSMDVEARIRKLKWQNFNTLIEEQKPGPRKLARAQETFPFQHGKQVNLVDFTISMLENVFPLCHVSAWVLQ